MADDADSKLGGPRAWFLLILLTAILAISLLDRQIVGILAGDIRRDLHLNDSEFGLIYGTFFGIFYALFSIPLGRLADGWSRTRQVALSLLGWSAATYGSALCHSFGPMAVMRTLVGVGEAGVGPASYSLISDLFPKAKRATAFAVYGSGTAIGVGLSSWIGGGIADAWTRAFGGGPGWFGLTGWQAAFVAVSVPAVLVALLMWRVREPPRGISDGLVQPGDSHPFRRAGEELMALLPMLSLLNLRRLRAPASAWVYNTVAFVLVCAGTIVATKAAESVTPPDRLTIYTTLSGFPITSHFIQWATVGLGIYAFVSWTQSQRLRDVVAHRVMWSSPTFIALIIAAALNMMVTYGLTAWGPLFAVRHYHASMAEVGAKLGLAIGVAGLIGVVGGGWLADVIRKRHPLGRLWVLLVCVTLPAPAVWITFSQPTLTRFAVAHTIVSLFLGGWLPCCAATLHDLVLPRMRGTAIALMYLSITIFGLGTGPYLVGLMSDITGDLGGSVLRLYGVSVLSFIAVVCALRTFTRDEATLLDRARAAGEPLEEERYNGPLETQLTGRRL